MPVPVLRPWVLAAIVAAAEAVAAAVVGISDLVTALRPVDPGTCQPGQACMTLDFRNLGIVVAVAFFLVAAVCALDAWLLYQGKASGVVLGLVINVPAALLALFGLVNAVSGAYRGGTMLLSLGALPLIWLAGVAIVGRADRARSGSEGPPTQ